MRWRAGMAQRYTDAMKSIGIILIGLACTLPALSHAQWQWIDKDGRKVFSDQSPPADIPAKNIVKQPGVKGQPVSADAWVAAASAASAPSKPAASAPKISGKDKELEERKKQAQTAEAEKKKAEEEKFTKAKADNCGRAKQAKSSYDSGMRIATTNAKGEREIVDDAARAVETKRLQGIIAADCAAS